MLDQLFDITEIANAKNEYNISKQYSTTNVSTFPICNKAIVRSGGRQAAMSHHYFPFHTTY